MNKETELMHEINLKLFANEIFKEGIYYIKIEKNLGCEIVLKEVKKDGCGIIYSFEILKKYEIINDEVWKEKTNDRLL